MNKDNKCNAFKSVTAFTFLALIVLLIYSNTFHAAWQFDDKPNIIDNARLHLEDLSPASLWQTFFAKEGREAFYRPLPNLSFALNWYVGKDDTFGYHLVNITIHLLSAFFLYLASGLLLQTPKVKPYCSRDDIGFIALLSAVLWAVNPIQIQAVTYIVQRMASMAAMFYILSIYWYLKGRLSEGKKKQALFFWGCFFSFIFALMSKENTAILPASLILIELIFFQDLAASLKKIKGHIPLLLVSGLILSITFIVIVIKTNFQFFAEGYDTRPFTPAERLLTQPRILLIYLSQIFYPLPGRLSITHDIAISKSLLSPLTTLPAILTILVLIAIAFYQIRKRPLVAFALLFFFLNHVIESSFLPLELFFEHRNYLPSLFLFLPIAFGLKYTFNLYKKANKFIYILMFLCVMLTIIGLGCFTYIRNQAWRTEATLWQDAMKKAPNDARPICNLAIQLAWEKNPSPLHYDAAMAMFNKALRLNKARNFLDQEIVGNMGAIYFQKGEYHKAIQLLNEALQMNPSYLKARYNLISSMIMLGQWEEASQQVDLLIDNPKKHVRPDYFNQKGFILLWQGKPEEALIYLRKALKMEPNNRAAVLLNTGVALSLMGKYRNAELLLNNAARVSPGDIRPAYALIENSVRAGNSQKTEKYVAQIFVKFSIQTILDGFAIFHENYRMAPMSAELILPVVKKKMMQLSEDIRMLTPNPSTVE